MSRALVCAGLALLVTVGGGAFQPAVGDEPSALPGQQGGDPKPDTETATQLVKQGRYEDAIASCKSALARDERYVPAMIQMAKAYYYLHKYELATSIIDLAKQLDANNGDAWHLLAWIALARNDNITATANFKKAVEVKPEFGNDWNSLAVQYLMQENYDPALEAAQHATQLLPNFDKAWLNLGSAYRGKGQDDEAEKAFRHALQINPNYADAYFNLGVLYLDAKQMPNMDLVTKLNTAIENLAKWKNLAGLKLANNDPSDGYIEQARKDIEREQKRLERLAKQKARDAAKKPAAPPPDATPPGAPPPADATPPGSVTTPPPADATPPPAAPAPTGAAGGSNPMTDSPPVGSTPPTGNPTP